ncbi:Mu transposase domain-containing protein, partial [Brevibacillus panacihumi]
RFVQLRAHYLFESYFCDPGKGHQKGQVENLVQFVQKQFFTPVPSVSSLDELNQILLEKCISYEKTTVPRSSLTVGEAFAQEQLIMLSLPPRPLECCRIVSVKSNTLSMIHFEKNAYSVPVSHASTELICRVFAERIEVYHGKNLIATHERCLDKGKELLQYDHYLDLLLTRPGAVLYARPIHQAGLPAIYQKFLDKCRYRPGGMKEFVRLLLLHREFDASLVEEALNEACQKGMFQYDAVRQLLFQRTLPEHRVPQLALAEDSSIPRIQVKSPDLSQYNRLLHKGSVVH